MCSFCFSFFVSASKDGFQKGFILFSPTFGVCPPIAHNEQGFMQVGN